MNKPMVTIVCLGYNHRAYMQEAIDSVFNQTYGRWQLIIVDDASTDGSPQWLSQQSWGNKNVQVILNDVNLGQIAAFNKAIPLVEGEYLIDLAADDILAPNRLMQGVKAFEKGSTSAFLHFMNATLHYENGKKQLFYPEVCKVDTTRFIKEQRYYTLLISRYFICAPTIMFNTTLFMKLGGYDASLDYEDFDILIRSSREYTFLFSNDVGVVKRELAASKGKRQYKFNSAQMRSTFSIFKKIKVLNKSEKENDALRTRILLEMKQCVKHFNLKLLWQYWQLYRSIV